MTRTFCKRRVGPFRRSSPRAAREPYPDTLWRGRSQVGRGPDSEPARAHFPRPARGSELSARLSAAHRPAQADAMPLERGAHDWGGDMPIYRPIYRDRPELGGPRQHASSAPSPKPAWLRQTAERCGFRRTRERVPQTSALTRPRHAPLCRFAEVVDLARGAVQDTRRRSAQIPDSRARPSRRRSRRGSGRDCVRARAGAVSPGPRPELGRDDQRLSHRARAHRGRRIAARRPSLASLAKSPVRGIAESPF